jgi:hypothetical protein
MWPGSTGFILKVISTVRKEGTKFVRQPANLASLQQFLRTQSVGVAALGAILAGCGATSPPAADPVESVAPTESTVSVDPAVTEQPSPVAETADDEPADPSDFVPHFEGDYWLVGPPNTSPTWPFDVPSGGVVSGAASGYEFDVGEPDDLATRSVAVAVGTVSAIGSPEAPTAHFDDLPEGLSTDDLVEGDVVIPLRVHIDDVLAGDVVEPGSDYAMIVSALEREGTLLEFEEDRLPEVGASYLMFVMVNRVEDIPVPGGRLRTTAAGAGRIPIETARSNGFLQADRWEPVLATDIGDEFAAELRLAGYLDGLPTPSD